MPELIETAEPTAAASTSQIESPVDKADDEFKLIVSKRKRRQQKQENEAMEEEEDDDYEIEQVDENLKIEDPSNNVFADANKKFKFPPISGDKLSVCLI